MLSRKTDASLECVLVKQAVFFVEKFFKIFWNSFLALQSLGNYEKELVNHNLSCVSCNFRTFSNTVVQAISYLGADHHL